jgi:hypothetical protein
VDEAHEVHGGGGGDMLKMRLGLPEVAGSPQAEAAHGLRYGGLDPGPQSVGAGELGRLLALSRRLQGYV